MPSYWYWRHVAEDGVWRWRSVRHEVRIAVVPAAHEGWSYGLTHESGQPPTTHDKQPWHRLSRDELVCIFGYLYPWELERLEASLRTPLFLLAPAHYSHLSIDASDAEAARQWAHMRPSAAVQWGSRAVNLRTITQKQSRRSIYGRSLVYSGWCIEKMVCLVEGHVRGRAAMIERQQRAAGAAGGQPQQEGSLEQITVTDVDRLVEKEDRQLQLPRFVGPPITFHSLTSIIGLDGHSSDLFDELKWRMPRLEEVQFRSWCRPAFVRSSGCLRKISASARPGWGMTTTTVAGLLDGMSTGALEQLEIIEGVELPGHPLDILSLPELRERLLEGGCRSLKRLVFHVPQHPRPSDPDERDPHWYPSVIGTLWEIDGLRSQLPARKIMAPNCTIELTFPADGISIKLGPAHGLPHPSAISPFVIGKMGQIARAITLIKWKPTTPRPDDDTDDRHSGATDPAAFADMHRFPNVKELQIKSGSIDLSQHPPTSPVWSALQLLPQDAFPEGMLLTAEGPVGCEAARQLAFTGKLAGKVASLALQSLSSREAVEKGDVMGVLEAMGSGEQLQEALLSARDREGLLHRLGERADYIPAIRHRHVSMTGIPFHYELLDFGFLPRGYE